MNFKFTTYCCLLSLWLNELKVHTTYLDEDGLEKVEKIIFPGLSDLLQSSRDIYLLDSWDTIIRLLGTHLHRKTSKIVGRDRYSRIEWETCFQICFRHQGFFDVHIDYKVWFIYYISKLHFREVCFYYILRNFLRSKRITKRFFKTNNNDFTIRYENSFWWISFFRVKSFPNVKKANLASMQFWIRTSISGFLESFISLKTSNV